MKIEALINESLVIKSLKGNTKAMVIKEMATHLHSLNRIDDLEGFTQAIMSREEDSSTGVGFGIAIPHAKTKQVLKPSLLFARHDEGVDYDALDGENSDLFFMIAVPVNAENLHLQTLAKLSRKLMDEDFRTALRQALDVEALLKLIESIDKEEK